MRLKSIELAGFKSFVKKTPLEFGSAITGIVGPNGSGKSNIAEAFRFVLGEQSMKSMRGRRGEDLIWSGSPSTPRSGRASVRLVFDNRDRGLTLDFDEVVIERTVHRDGVNDYLLNNSRVRLRDIAELLAHANIGGSGHHIISQGEADRVLSTSPRERREMIEDALGLTAYLYKRGEAERKLDKTADNMREVASLRRELAPHLKFLATQVRKVEEAKQMRADLAEHCAEYLKREDVYLKNEEKELSDAMGAPKAESKSLEARIAGLRKELSGKKGNSAGTSMLMELEARGRSARERRESVSRELGRIEGELAAHARLTGQSDGQVPAGEARAFAERLERGLSEALTLEGATLKERLETLRALAKEFIQGIATRGGKTPHSVEELSAKKGKLEGELENIAAEEERISSDVAALRRRIESEKDAANEAQRELFEAMARRGELEAQLVSLRAREEMLARDQANFKNEFTEAGVLLGSQALMYESYRVRGKDGHEVATTDMVGEPRTKQEERRRALERMKIKLEELGAGGGEEILKEHQETLERDRFLERELADLGTSSEKLRALIDELTETLETRFVEGIEKINKEFDAFFKLMFGGGSAKLSVVKEKKLRKSVRLEDDDLQSSLGDEDDIEVEEGIDIAINLPHKRIKGLHALSGGERALTSIALIFAMSTVSAPPFLILDETDAALDEANSRRYGDMIENLAKKSQLILITHNRETMSRAGVLYGVTMGSDGVSKLLSVKFEEAVAVAK